MAFDQAWQLTTLVIVVLLIVRFAARNRPHLAYMLWLVVLFKAVTPPVFSSPTGVFSWLHTTTSSETLTASESLAVLYVAPPSVASRDELSADNVAFAPAVEPKIRQDPARLTTRLPILKPSNATAEVYRLGIVVIWSGGLCVALIVTFVQWSRCIWLLHVAPTVARPDLEDLVTKLSRQLRVRRRVRLLVTTSRIGPAVIGLFRPLIVLPEIVVQGKRANELEAMIAHELLHVRRGDLWLGLLQVCAKALWWFHPLVWWAGRMSTREAERCCDEQVIGELQCDPKRYARSLLEVLELKRTLRTVPAFPGMKPVEVTSQRLERIMKLGRGCHKQTPPWCWAVMLLLAAATLPGAGFVLATDEPGGNSANDKSELQVFATTADARDSASHTVRISVEILRAPRNTVDAAIVGWRVAEMDLSDTNTHVGDGGIVVKEAELPLPEPSLAPKAVSSHAVETRLPALYKIVNDLEAEAISRRILKNRNANKLTAPRVVVFSGQSASIMDASQRPFVVGLQTRGKPQIRVVSEGMTLYVRPQFIDKKQLGLTYDLKITRITDVSTTTFSLEGHDTPVTFQIPEVETSSVKSTLTFAAGKTLVIGGLTTKDEKGNKQATLVMLKATQLPPTNQRSQLMFGSGVNSNAGVTGQIIVDERSLQKTPPELHSLLGPLTDGDANELPPPSDELVLEALKHHQEIGVPFLYDVERHELRIVKEKISDYVDPARVIPLLGPAELHHAHYRCTVYYTTREKVSWPVALEHETPVRHVVYIDHNHFHLIAPKGTAAKLRDVPNPTLVKTYSVADLVIPLPSAENGPREWRVSKEVVPDFNALIDLIKTTIEPDTWAERRGSGLITPSPVTLSVIVSQSKSVHRRIENLLQQLRRLQDVQITLEAKLLQVPKSFFEPGELPGFEINDFPVGVTSDHDELAKQVELSDIETFFLLQAIDNGDDAWAHRGPKVTVFNGQEAHVSMQPDGFTPLPMEFHAIVSQDRKSVRLSVAAGKNGQLKSTVPQKIKDGNSVLLRVDGMKEQFFPGRDGEGENARSLFDIPYVARLFKNTPAPKEHVFLLLVTPKVIIVGEEAELKATGSDASPTSESSEIQND
ncbi:MAG: hypothetical protein H8E66_00935 [Planctomycetes bacterium]|nr:hypothetical protein [Planctomycetota bacterium]